MEEVAPVATNDASLLAPEEIQAKPRRPDLGVTEKTPTDRKRERRLKKKHKRLRNSEKKQQEKVLVAGLGSISMAAGLGSISMAAGLGAGLQIMVVTCRHVCVCVWGGGGGGGVNNDRSSLM
jgi:hypothetical protein